MRAVTLNLLLVLMCVLAGSARALAPVPDETGYLTDQTGIIEPAAMAQIQLRLAQYHAEHQRKIAVLLVQETPGEELEAYADRVLDQWGLRRVKNGGALVLWSAEGYILIRATEDVLPLLSVEAQSEIISRWIVPAYAEGDPARGILDGVGRMMAVIAGEPVGERVGEQAPMPPTDNASQMIDEMLQLEDGAPEDVAFEVEPPLELPAWLDSFPSEFARITFALVQHPVAGLRDVWTEAGGQADQVGMQVRGLATELGGQGGGPDLLPLSRNAYYVLAGIVGLTAVLLLRGAWVAGALLMGVAGSIALWTATGFVALAVVVFVAAMLLPLTRQLIVAILSQQGSEESDDLASERMKAQIAALGSGPRSTSTSRPVRTSSLQTRLATSASPKPAFPPTGSVPHRGPVSAQEMEELRYLASATVRHALKKARLWHLAAAIALAVMSFGLLILAGLALVVYFAASRGVVYKFLEMAGRRNPDIRSILQHLPRPDPRDLPTSSRGSMNAT